MSESEQIFHTQWRVRYMRPGGRVYDPAGVKHVGDVYEASQESDARAWVEAMQDAHAYIQDPVIERRLVGDWEPVDA